MEDIKIISTLGKGMYGTTYLVKKNNKKYALKRQKILRIYITKNTKYSMWREFYFFNYISKLDNFDKKFFMKLIDYKFYSNCDFNNNFESNNKLLLKLNRSNHCLDQLVELKDGVLKDIIYKLNNKQKISMIIQCIYAMYLMHKSGYYHCDLHTKNIAYKKTKNKYITINNNKIKTYGYQYSFIDYGLIINKRFLLNRKEKKKLEIYQKFNKDMNIFLSFSIFNIREIIKIKDNKIKQNFINYFKNNYISLYDRIKSIILFNYPEYKTYNDINKHLFMEIIQYISIYDNDILKKYFKTEYKLLPSHILEFIKLNMNKENSYFNVINYLFNLL
jgi:hypothetical protein